MSDRIVVVGGGIAGVASATILAERGLKVLLIEREGFLGGRAGAWTEHLGDGGAFEMERGFHAFFRHYYNLRALLRRIDPKLSMLQPLEDYPILGPDGMEQSFRNLPKSTPLNVAVLTARSKALGLRDLMRVDKKRALEMLRYERDRTYAEFDGKSAKEYLDSLNFPPAARRLLFDVFAHSFFNPEEDMSAAELLMMFHFYFTGNSEGLIFDVCHEPFSTAIWDPFTHWLRERNVEIRLRSEARRLRRLADGWIVETDAGEELAGGVVLALPVPPLQRICEGSDDLDDASWRSGVESLALTNRFAVWRLWLDTPTRPGRAPFVGTTSVGILDNISLYHEFQSESREWAFAHGGSVVELHAYAVDPSMSEADIRQDLLDGLHRFYPETQDAKILEQRWLLRQDCPAFGLGSDATRPGVETPWEDLCLAGDFVRLPFPSALMERAAASGFMAANRLLEARGIAPEKIEHIATAGLFALKKKRAARA